MQDWSYCQMTYLEKFLLSSSWRITLPPFCFADPLLLEIEKLPESNKTQGADHLLFIFLFFFQKLFTGEIDAALFIDLDDLDHDLIANIHHILNLLDPF